MNVRDVVIEVWAEVLPTADIGSGTGFLRDGGSSLAAVRACARLGARLGIPVPIELFFTHQHLDDFVAELTALVARRP